MFKHNEQNLKDSCWNKAADNEMLFILLGRDAAAPATIEFWIKERIRLGLNQPNDDKIFNAQQCARLIRNLLETEKENGKSKSSHQDQQNH